MTDPVFIVSTGRCGSTMLSEMVNRHPDMLSLSEFFTSLASRGYLGRHLSGPALHDRLGTPRRAGRALLTNGLTVDEFLYPLGRGGRYGASEIPPVLCTMLPHLTDDPDALWDALVPAMRARPTDTVAAQYRFVFDWLRERLGRKVWLERSGSSLLYVDRLARMFPDARFVHIHRDGRDTAMSMSKHHFFRLRVDAIRRIRRVGLNPYADFNQLGTSPWQPVLEWILFRRFDADVYRRTEIPLEAFGDFWSRSIGIGLRALAKLPPERLLTLRFETLCAEPRSELHRFARFVGPEFETDAWVAEAATLPKTRPPGWRRLDADAGARLTEACRPGLAALGYETAANPIPA